MIAKLPLASRQVLACFMLLAAAGMIAATYSIIAVPLAREFQPSRAVLMLAMTILAGTCAVLSPLLGELMDRFSVRRLMLGGCLLLACGYAAISLVQEFWHVLLIFGVLIAPANVLIGPVAMTVLLSRWYPNRRGRAVGIAIAGISAGGMLFPFVIQGFLDAHDWRAALQLLGLVLLFWTVPAALMVVDRPAGTPAEASRPDHAEQDRPAEAEIAPVSAIQIFTDPAFWLIVCTVAIVTAGMKGMVTNLVPMAVDNGIDATDAARLISLFAGASLIAKFNFAALSDRVGPRILIGCSLGGFALGLCCLTQAQAGYWVIALGVILTGLFGGLMVPMESYLVPRIFGRRVVGRAMGLLSGTTLIAMLSTPPLFGLIFDLTGSYRAIFWTFGLLGFMAVLWVPMLRLHPRGHMPAPAE